MDYETWKDLGHKCKAKPSPDFKKIRVYFVFDAKNDVRYKARLVSNSHLTDTSLSSTHCVIVLSKGIRLFIFLAELNRLESRETGIRNTCLEAKTKKKVCIIAEPEFGPLKDFTLMTTKALYGRRTSGSWWHERLASCLRGMGFQHRNTEPEMMMRREDNKEHPNYERIAICVDDLL